MDFPEIISTKKWTGRKESSVRCVSYWSWLGNENMFILYCQTRGYFFKVVCPEKEGKQMDLPPYL